jgi:hypothetical protein
MMSPESMLLLGSGVVLVGRWSQGKKVTAKIAVGGVFAGVVIAVMADTAPGLAQSFALLFLVSIVLTYLGPVLTNINKSTGSQK